MFGRKLWEFDYSPRNLLSFCCGIFAPVTRAVPRGRFEDDSWGSEKNEDVLRHEQRDPHGKKDHHHHHHHHGKRDHRHHHHHGKRDHHGSAAEVSCQKEEEQSVVCSQPALYGAMDKTQTTNGSARTTDETAGADNESSSSESDEDMKKRYQLLKRSASGSTTKSMHRSSSDRSTTTIASRTTVVATVSAAPANATAETGGSGSVPGDSATTLTATGAAAGGGSSSTDGAVSGVTGAGDSAARSAAATTANGVSSDAVVHREDVREEGKAKEKKKKKEQQSEERGTSASSSSSLNKPHDPSTTLSEDMPRPPTADDTVTRETTRSISDTGTGLPDKNDNKMNSRDLEELITHDTPHHQPAPAELQPHTGPEGSEGLESQDVTSHRSQQQELESRDAPTKQSSQAFGSRDIPVSQSPRGLESRGSVTSQSSRRQKSSSLPQVDPSAQVAGATIRTEEAEGGGSDYGNSVNGEVGSETGENQALASELPETTTLASFSGSEQALIPGNDEHLFDVSDLQHEPPLISKCGSLEVTFSYNAVRGKMTVQVHRAREIPSKDRGGASNTQVRGMLLPTKKQRFKTKVKEGEEPVFDETFVFNKIFTDEIPGLGVRFRLYGLERMRREYMIGESVIGFASLNLVEPTTHWIILEPRSNLSHGDSGFDVSSLSRSDSASSMQSLQHGGMPELLVGLAYHATTGRLAVQVVKGSNFRNMATNRPPDTYVKVTLMSSSGQELQTCKTSIRRGQPNPLFKETFMLQVAHFQLPEVTLMVSVYNKRSMKKKEMIGWFSLGQNSSGEEEGCHWADMRESKGEEVSRWHVLLES